MRCRVSHQSFPVWGIEFKREIQQADGVSKNLYLINISMRCALIVRGNSDSREGLMSQLNYLTRDLKVNAFIHFKLPMWVSSFFCSYFQSASAESRIVHAVIEVNFSSHLSSEPARVPATNFKKTWATTRRGNYWFNVTSHRRGYLFSQAITWC